VGYEPYHYRTTSDHRGLFLDLDIGTLFGNATTALAAQPFQDLRFEELQSNTTYIDATSVHLHSNHFFQNLTTLLTTRDDALAVRLDNLLVQACQHNEKQCRKRVSLWWSWKLTQAHLHRNFLYRALCGFRNNIDVRLAIKARMTELDVHFDIPSTKEECNNAFKEDKAEYTKIARDHLNTRLAELDEAAEAHALAKHKDKAHIVKEIKHQECFAATFREIRNVTRPAHARGSTSIEVPTAWPTPSDDITSRTFLPDPKKASTWPTVDLPKDVLHYLLLQNRLHFGQAEGTSLTLPPFLTDLDWEASTATAGLILEGAYSNNELRDIQELLIAHCAQLSPLDDIPPTITIKEFESCFRTGDERTSTSPSGIHLGHY
jgi:hypothetical protein